MSLQLGYQRRAVITRAHPSLKCRIRGVVQADMSPVSMLEVFAHLAQGDIPLLSIACTETHATYVLSERLLLQSMDTTTNVDSIKNSCILN